MSFYEISCGFPAKSHWRGFFLPAAKRILNIEQGILNDDWKGKG
jgi:hypothetical protein